MPDESIVLELQRDALDEKVKVSVLLRKALVVARKLELKEFHEWVEKEINGYANMDSAPEYRNIIGELKAWNPYQGWQIIFIQDRELNTMLTNTNCVQSVVELEVILQNQNKDTIIHMPIDAPAQSAICRAIGHRTEVRLFISSTFIHRIINAVRTIILNWTLNLEEQEILGEGLTFTKREREAAVSIPQNITNFYGLVEKAQVQQGTIDSTQIIVTESVNIDAIKEFLAELGSKSSELELDDTVRAELEAEINTLRAQVESPKPKAGIIKESLISLRTIMESASGTVAGQLLLVGISKLLS